MDEAVLHCIASIDNLNLSRTLLLSSYILSIHGFVKLLVTVDNMRLLDTTTLKLHEFFDVDVPDYAILSHTWSTEEVTFQEMTDLFDEDGCQCGKANKRAKTRAKAGYQKIWACCQRAKRDRIDYAWIDTCCIDKSSSAELSEAINSMWRWYQLSWLCYVYLEDVKPRQGQPSNDFEQALTKSRWITRGWCLQELLAPGNVIFLAQDWSALGLKCELSSPYSYHIRRYSRLPIFTAQISRSTLIPKEVLSMEKHTDHCSIAQKMSWAANRQTSRREDVAYCLFGLFGINLPLLYGEGDRAFLRLQDQLIRSELPDHSILAFRSSVYHTEPASALALSPAQFQKSGNIKRSSRNPYVLTMTSSGVETELELGLWRDRKSYIALLECFDGSGDQLAVLLLPVFDLVAEKEAYQTYARAQWDHLTPIRLDRAMRRELEKLRPFQREKVRIARHYIWPGQSY